MNKFKTQLKSTLSTMLLCLSLLVYTMPATAMVHSLDHEMSQESSSDQMHLMQSMQMPAGDEHCDEMQVEMTDDCCQDMGCDCICVTTTSLFMNSFSTIHIAYTSGNLPDIGLANLNAQFAATPSPPPII